jgi:hypothetical protein
MSTMTLGLPTLTFIALHNAMQHNRGGMPSLTCQAETEILRGPVLLGVADAKDGNAIDSECRNGSAFGVCLQLRRSNHIRANEAIALVAQSKLRSPLLACRPAPCVWRGIDPSGLKHDEHFIGACRRP